MINSAERIVHGVRVRPRPIIAPTTQVSAKTDAEKRDVIRYARRVIATHRDVMIALRDR